MPQTITMLTGLQTGELTLTKRGANGRRFAMTKSQGALMDPEVLQALIGTPAEGEDAFIATLKSQNLNEEQTTAAVATYRMQKGMKDLISDDILALTAKSAGYEGTAKAVHLNEGKKDKEGLVTRPAKTDPEAKKRDPLGKSINLAGLDDADRAQVEAVFKSNAAMEDRAGKLETIVKSLQEAAETKEYVAKAATEFSHVPMATDELATILKSAHQQSPEMAKSIETLLGRVNDTVKKSALLDSMGGGGMPKTGGAMEKLTQLSSGIIQKSLEGGNEMTQAQAFDRVIKTEVGARLYEEYLSENPAQRARSYQ